MTGTDSPRESDEEQERSEATVTYEPDRGESIPTAVVAAVSSARNRAKTELEPLYAAVDPEALAALFRPSGRGGPGYRRASFTYADCEIVVVDTDRVTVSVRDESKPRAED